MSAYCKSCPYHAQCSDKWCKIGSNPTFLLCLPDHNGDLPGHKFYVLSRKKNYFQLCSSINQSDSGVIPGLFSCFQTTLLYLLIPLCFVSVDSIEVDVANYPLPIFNLKLYFLIGCVFGPFGPGSIGRRAVATEGEQTMSGHSCQGTVGTATEGSSSKQCNGHCWMCYSVEKADKYTARFVSSRGDSLSSPR